MNNPVVVMSQELSKKFITGKPEDFYAYLMEATLLQEDYENISSTNDQVDQAKEAYDIADKSMGEVRSRLEKVRSGAAGEGGGGVGGG